MTKITYDQLREMLPGARSYSTYTAGTCPFHDDRKPSLLLFEDGWFRCLGCGVVGGYEKLYRKLKGVDYSRTVKVAEKYSPPYLPTDLIAQENLIELAHSSLSRFSQLQWYIEKRGVADRIEPCRLGFYRGWYTIPIYAENSTYLGMVARAGGNIQSVTGLRFVQPDGQKTMMYCPDWTLMRKANTIAVVFGMFDALALSSLRFAVVTPIGGKDHFNPKWLDRFRKKVVIIPDAEEDASALELCRHLGWRGSILRLPYPEGIKDPAGYLEINQRDKLFTQLAGPLS